MGLEYLNLKRLFRAKFEAHVFSVFSTIQEITRPVEKLRQPLQSLKSQLNSQARTCVQQVLFLARLQVHQTVEVRCSCAEFKLCWREIADTTNDALFSGSFLQANPNLDLLSTFLYLSRFVCSPTRVDCKIKIFIWIFLLKSAWWLQSKRPKCLCWVTFFILQNLHVVC